MPSPPLNTNHLPISHRTSNLLPRLLDLLQHRGVGYAIRIHVCGLLVEVHVVGGETCCVSLLASCCGQRGEWKVDRRWMVDKGGRETFSLLEDAVDGAGAAGAGHCDVEFVVVGC